MSKNTQTNTQHFMQENSYILLWC